MTLLGGGCAARCRHVPGGGTLPEQAVILLAQPDEHPANSRLSFDGPDSLRLHVRRLQQGDLDETLEQCGFGELVLGCERVEARLDLRRHATLNAGVSHAFNCLTAADASLSCRAAHSALELVES